MKFEAEIISSKNYIINLIGKVLFFVAIVPVVFVLDFRFQGGIFKALNVPKYYYSLVWFWIISLSLISFYFQSKKYKKGKIIFNKEGIKILLVHSNINQIIRYSDIQSLKITFNKKPRNKYSRNIIEGGNNWIEIINNSDYRFEIYLKSERKDQELISLFQYLDSSKIIKNVIIHHN